MLGLVDEAQRLYEKANAIGEKHSMPEVCIRSQLMLAVIAWVDCDFDKATEYTESMNRQARGKQLYALQCEALLQLATMHLAFLNIAEAYSCAKEAHYVACVTGLVEEEVSSSLKLYAIERMRGRHSESFVYLRAAKLLCQGKYRLLFLPKVLLAEAEAASERREFHLALHCLEEAVDVAEQSKQFRNHSNAMLAQRAIYLQIGDEMKAHECSIAASQYSLECASGDQHLVRFSLGFYSVIATEISEPNCKWYLDLLKQYEAIGVNMQFPLVYVNAARALVNNTVAKDLLWKAVDLMVQRVDDLWYLLSLVLDRLSLRYSSLDMVETARDLQVLVGELERLSVSKEGLPASTQPELRDFSANIAKALDHIRYDGDRCVK